MIRMNKDNKQLIKYLGIIFTAILLTYRLPHDSYSVIQYIIMPIRNRDSVLYLSGLVPLILFIIGIRGILTIWKTNYLNLTGTGRIISMKYLMKMIQLELESMDFNDKKIMLI